MTDRTPGVEVAPDDESPATRDGRRPRWMGRRRHLTDPVLEPLLRSVRAHHPQADLALLERTYATAARLHEGQTRENGDPCLARPLAVTTILAELGMTEPTLVAALLRDSVERAPYTLERLTKDFGVEVTQLVDGVTRLDKVQYGDAAQAESIRKMIAAMSKDIRVLAIVLAERLHDLRTLPGLEQEARESVARQALDIYAPLADRLGMNTLVAELEDLAFATLQPGIHDEIVRLVAERAPARDLFLARVIAQVEKDLADAKVSATVTGRAKHYYSIYRKMVDGGKDFSDIYDLVGIRIVVPEDRDCYSVLGVLHSRWNPVLGRFKDYVALPKFNMYQSLHTTIIGPEGKPVEVQVRTQAMHRRATFGVAAEWRYRASNRARRDTDRQTEDADDVGWVKQLLDWQSGVEDPTEVIESLRFADGQPQVYVFTPRGDVIALPSGSTPVDFAYAVHTEVGHRTIGAQVNGRLVELDLALDNGDVVEAFTSDDLASGPKREWLQFARSRRATRSIRRWYRQLPQAAAAQLGEDALIRIVEAEGLPPRLLSRARMKAAAAGLGFQRPDDLTAAIGRGSADEWSALRLLIEIASREPVRPTAEHTRRTPARTPERSQWRRAVFDGRRLPVVRGLPGIPTRFAKCCDPQPGDLIAAVVVDRKIASVHRAACPRLGEHDSQRLVRAAWVGSDGGPAWARTVECEVLVTGPAPDTDLQAIVGPDIVVGIAARQGAGARSTPGTAERVLRLRITRAEALQEALQRLRAAPAVAGVELLGRSYLTATERKRRRRS